MEIRIFKTHCKRCNHIWVPRKPKVFVCPKCHSAKWDEQSGNKSSSWKDLGEKK